MKVSFNGTFEAQVEEAYQDWLAENDAPEVTVEEWALAVIAHYVKEVLARKAKANVERALLDAKEEGRPKSPNAN